MGEKYSVNQRIRGGAFVGRLNPEFGTTHLNQKLGPHLGNIHNTEGNSLQIPDPEHRRRNAMLPDRFFRKSES